MKRPRSRGYSILAALVFVAVLSSIAFGVNLLSPESDRVAMSAASINIFALDAPAKPPPLGYEIEGSMRRCDPGFDYKVFRDKEGKIQVEPKPICPPPNAKPSPLQDVNSNTAAAVLAAGVGATDSRCKTDHKTNQSVPKDKWVCKVQFCVKAGGREECKDAGKLFEAGKGFAPSEIDKQLRSSTVKDLLRKTDPSEHQKLLSEMGVLPSEQGILNEVYQEGKQNIRNELDQIGNDNARIDERLKQLAFGCSEESSSTCEEVQQLQKTKEANEERQRDLTRQMDSLANAEKAMLTPTTCRSAACVDAEIEARRRTECKSEACVRGEVDKRNTFPPAPPAPGPGPGPGPAPQSGGNPLGALSSLLSGLMKGLAGAKSGQGVPCSSDPNVYQQQQQQYQMQLQQYNYQLQQYNYMQQQAYYYGSAPVQPPTPPQSCTPNPQQNTCPAPPPQPTSGCTNGTWQPVRTTQSNGQQCTSSWQCGPSTATQPAAELSCQPKVADVGMSVAISFSCANATGSTGSGAGFSTDNQTSGSRNVTIENPPANATGITFAVTCRNQSLSARAECAVQIARPTIVLVANPKSVASGEMSRIGWVTSGMQSCVISSPQMPGFSTQNANNKSVNGSATTSPLTRDTTVVLTCETISGNTKAASTTVTVGGSASSTVMDVTSTIDGKQDVKHNASTTITWSTPSAPSNSAVALWLVDMLSGQATGLIERSLATSGTFEWKLPATSTPCAVDSPMVCGADLVAGRSYSIQASLYTPPNAYLGGYPPANPITPTYLDEDFTTPFKIGN